MERAVRFIEEHDGSQNGRIKDFSPSQVDTCTEDLLRRSRQAATICVFLWRYTRRSPSTSSWR